MRLRLSCLLGNVFYYYNSSLFGWAAPFMASTVFPEQTGLLALVYVYAFLPLKHIARPGGALLFGWLGDQWGRAPVLTICLVGMVVSTIGIGCIPSGHYAGLLLGFFCVMQGFFAAGETKGAAIYLLEHTPNEKRSWMSSVYDASGIAGILCASLATMIFGAEHWRYLFLLGALVGLIGALLRKDGEEAPGFKPTKFRWRVLWEERGAVLSIIFVSGFSYANYYLVTIFLNGILPYVSLVSSESALMLNTHLLWIDFLLLLGIGIWAKNRSRPKIMGFAALAVAVCAIPVFSLFSGAGLAQVAVLRFILVFFGVALAVPYHAWKLDILPKHHRLFVGTFASSIGAKFLGAPMPALAAYLVETTGWIGSAGLPLVILGVAAFLCLKK